MKVNDVFMDNEIIDRILSQPWIEKKMKIHDTCGVHNLHGMPGVLGSALSCVLAAVAVSQNYGDG